MTFSPGIPVEIGRIEKELKALWTAQEAVSTRASLINLVVYSEDPDGLRTNSEMLALLTRNHACRAILVVTDRNSPDTGIQAWINANCSVSKSGSKQICCEQISFLIKGEAVRQTPNLVLSHLDSDLPLHLWWQGAELYQFADRQFWRWVDRLIIDSHLWPNPKTEFERMNSQIVGAPVRRIPCDLNWARFIYLRLAFSQFFDHPSALAQAPQLHFVEIQHCPGMRLTALLALGWLAAQFGWTVRRANPDRSSICLENTATGRPVQAVLSEKPGPVISRFAVQSPGALLEITRDDDSDRYVARMDLPGEGDTTRTLPAGKGDPASLVSEELMRGGKHKVYLRALPIILPLL